jgi:hypothetical protein
MPKEYVLKYRYPVPRRNGQAGLHAMHKHFAAENDVMAREMADQFLARNSQTLAKKVYHSEFDGLYRLEKVP